MKRSIQKRKGVVVGGYEETQELVSRQKLSKLGLRGGELFHLSGRELWSEEGCEAREITIKKLVPQTTGGGRRKEMRC